MDSPEQPEPPRFDVPPGPVSFLGLVRATGYLYRARWAAIVGCYLLFFVPYAALSALAVEASDDSVATETILDSVAILVFALAGSLLVALSALVLGDHLAGRTTSVRVALRSLKTVARELLAAALLVAVIIMLSLFIPVLSLVIAPLILGPPIVAHVMALEGRTLNGAWARTKELTSAHWSRVLVYLATLTLALNLTQVLVLIGVGNPVSSGISSDALAALVIGALAGVLLALVLPIIATAGFVMYLDLRARKEGLDPAAFAAERASEPEADATPD